VHLLSSAPRHVGKQHHDGAYHHGHGHEAREKGIHHHGAEHNERHRGVALLKDASSCDPLYGDMLFTTECGCRQTLRSYNSVLVRQLSCHWSHKSFSPPVPKDLALGTSASEQVACPCLPTFRRENRAGGGGGLTAPQRVPTSPPQRPSKSGEKRRFLCTEERGLVDCCEETATSHQ
jgi:hypothetical protein